MRFITKHVPELPAFVAQSSLQVKDLIFVKAHPRRQLPDGALVADGLVTGDFTLYLEPCTQKWMLKNETQHISHAFPSLNEAINYANRVQRYLIWNCLETAS